MKRKILAGTTFGFALFAMFFGAGNLILPPYIGMKSGQEWLAAVGGFFTTGIVAPFLGVLVVALYGTSFSDLGKRTSPLLITILALLIMLCVGPLIAIPRTASTSFEIGLLPHFPSANSGIFSLIFFVVIFILSVSKSKIVDIIGNYLTPFLMISLGVLVVAGLNTSFESQNTDTQFFESYMYGFHEGYQTLDVLVSVIFAGIIISAAIGKGFTEKTERFRITILAGLISMFALLFIYGGLVFLGAHSGFSATDSISRTDLLLNISHNVLGKSGTFVISVAIVFACLTTAIALTAAMGDFLERFSKGLIKYKVGVLLTCLVSGVLSVNSVDDIISYAAIILNFVYPITFVLILSVLIFGRKITYPQPYLVATAVSGLIALLSVFQAFDVNFVNALKSALPLSQYNLEWLLPSAVGFLLAMIFGKKKKC